MGHTIFFLKMSDEHHSPNDLVCFEFVCVRMHAWVCFFLEQVNLTYIATAVIGVN